MAGAEERSVGWNVRKLYDKPNPEHLEDSAFFEAFAEFHDLNGRRIECILTKPKYQRMSVSVSGSEAPLLAQVSSILFVRLADMSGMHQSESLKVDGVLYVIAGVSYPLHGLARLELAGVQG